MMPLWSCFMFLCMFMYVFRVVILEMTRLVKRSYKGGYLRHSQTAMTLSQVISFDLGLAFYNNQDLTQLPFSLSSSASVVIKNIAIKISLHVFSANHCSCKNLMANYKWISIAALASLILYTSMWSLFACRLVLSCNLWAQECCIRVELKRLYFSLVFI